MDRLPPNPELLRSLARLVRGLSALFWGLPTALLVCVYTARADWLRPYYGFIPPVAACGWLLYGLRQMGHFQRQERVWIEALDFARLLCLVLVGLCPFLYWANKAPGENYFAACVSLLAVVGLLFLATLNLVLRRLSAMLPDETLRLEINHFTPINRGVLVVAIALLVAYRVLSGMPDLPPGLANLVWDVEHGLLWLSFGLILILFPVAMTMALLWKTKQVILDSVFNRAGGS